MTDDLRNSLLDAQLGSVYDFVQKRYILQTRKFTEMNADEFLPYMPQNTSALGLYAVYQELGLTPLQAYMNVLHACVGEKPPFEVPKKEGGAG